jgi:hypothetical protein
LRPPLRARKFPDPAANGQKIPFNAATIFPVSVGARPGNRCLECRQIIDTNNIFRLSEEPAGAEFPAGRECHIRYSRANSPRPKGAEPCVALGAATDKPRAGAVAKAADVSLGQGSREIEPGADLRSGRAATD